MPGMSLPSLEDDLVARLRTGEQGAFEQFARQFAKPVLDLAYHLTGDYDSARDIRQLALWRAYRGVSRFEGRAQLSTWLYRIVVNLCRDWSRTADAQDRLIGAWGARSTSAGPDQTTIDESERRHVIRQAMGALEPVHREVLALRHLRAITFREMSLILDRPESTVKSQCAAALDQLHKELVARGLVTSDGQQR